MKKAILNSNSRIVVVGTSGAGKSTLARRLSFLLNLKDIELDALFWGPNWTQCPQDVFRERIQTEIDGAQGWVIHGNYSKVRDLTCKNANVLIWLDYSKPLVFWRVLKRSVLRMLFQEKLWSGNVETFQKTFLSKDSIILWSIQTYDLRRKQYEELIRSSEYSHLTVIRLKTPNEAEKFVASLKP